MYYKVLFMKEENMTSSVTPLETLQDIKRMMERSSRFLSLSGLSGMAAGLVALVGAYFAYDWIAEYNVRAHSNPDASNDFFKLKINLLLLAIAVLAVALVLAFYFTWRKAAKNHLPVWDITSKRLVTNMLIPLISGAGFILAMLQQDEWRFVVPACLIFYGLSLFLAGKYTLNEIRYLGYCEILLGLASTQFIGYGIFFWAAGFGFLHILYGLVMWWKYERK